MAIFYSELTRAPSTNTTARIDFERSFVEEMVILYGILDHLLTDSGPKFVEKLFNTVYLASGTRVLTTSAHHLQTNDLSELYNKALMLQASQNIRDKKIEWGTFLHSLEYDYSD